MRKSENLETGVRYTNANGAWAEIHFDAQGGYQPGLGPVGLWYAKTWAPDFAEGIESSDLSARPHRSHAVRSAQNWLAKR
jgi:hypothetical protein